MGSATLVYAYDALYRLKTATYTSGNTFSYTYDAVGNRLTEQLNGGAAVNYVYDSANRLTSVGAQTYTWDNNGNLKSDGTRTYAYDSANRPAQIVQGGVTYTFSYNGQGDRVRQAINGTPTRYVLDLNAPLTQILADGSNTYLYGSTRIGEQQASGFAYHYLRGFREASPQVFGYKRRGIRFRRPIHWSLETPPAPQSLPRSNSGRAFRWWASLIEGRSTICANTRRCWARR